MSAGEPAAAPDCGATPLGPLRAAGCDEPRATLASPFGRWRVFIGWLFAPLWGSAALHGVRHLRLLHWRPETKGVIVVIDPKARWGDLVDLLQHQAHGEARLKDFRNVAMSS